MKNKLKSTDRFCQFGFNNSCMESNNESVMKGPSVLNEVNITANVPNCPGVFLLIKSEGFDAVYAGRSDNLRLALLSHLPENEKIEEINKIAPDRFLSQVTDDLGSAFEIECRWFHIFKPSCNQVHPSPYRKNKPCPVCRFDRNSA